jgi:hypothetical protein
MDERRRYEVNSGLRSRSGLFGVIPSNSTAASGNRSRRGGLFHEPQPWMGLKEEGDAGRNYLITVG